MAPNNSKTSKIESLVTHGRTAANTLKEMLDSDSQNVPYLRVIGGVTLLILDIFQNVRANKQQCIKMVERINDIVIAIINICGESGGSELSPAIFRNISSLTETLQKVHTFIRNQVDMNVVRRITRHLENEAQLNECNVALQQAMEVFTIRTGLLTTVTMTEMKISNDKRHNELVERFVESRVSLDRSSFASSSNSLSILLPVSPQIFRGREVELKHLVSHLLSPDASRSAILGPGGIGKSSLALASLHHPDVLAACGENRFFIPLDSARSPEDLLSLVAAYFGLEQCRQVAKAIIQYLHSIDGPAILVLDNFESPWEEPTTRSKIEDFLSQLTDIPRLHVIVTMRGAERPTKTRWTRPFLPPLETLNRAAAREVFLDIVDEIKDDSQLEALLDLTDNLPLALNLLANITAYEGADSVLNRWSFQATSLLSEGVDKGTNLDKSISISLSSPRMTALPNARQLLSLLSLLPDGIQDAALTEMSLPFDDVTKCRVALCRTSLAYIGRDRKLKVLAPIREYIRTKYPPSPQIFRSLKEHIYSLVRLSRNFESLPSTGLVHLISNNLGNVHTILIRAVDSHESAAELKDTVFCILELAKFSYYTNLASWSYQLVDGLLDTVKSLNDTQLLGHYLFTMGQIHALQSAHESFTKDALQCFKDVDDPLSQAKAYVHLSAYYIRAGQAQKSLDICYIALPLAEEAGDLAQLAEVFVRLSQIHRQLGHSGASLKYARDACSTAKSAGSMLVEARALRQYACCCVCVGDYTRSTTLCAEARVILDALGMADVRNNIYRNLLNVQAQTHNEQTDYVLARQLNALLIGTPGEQRTQEKISEAYALINIAGADINMGRWADPSVRQNIDTARSLMAGTSNKQGVPACDFTLADLYFHQGDYRTSGALYAQCLLVFQGQSAEVEVLCRQRLADVAFAEEDTPRATRLSFVLLAFALRVHDLAATHQALRRIGDIFRAQGDSDTAQSLFGLALSGFTLMGVHRARGDCLVRLGDIHRQRGDYAEARTRWTEARALFDRSSQLRDAQSCEERLANTEST
ncbi:hypothetical protein C8R44DRAFT_848628 [Mycena epipterygia]|nr:hypothetical protein C8R44DRAFT_848628 [Mycena epipterygia]